MNLQVNREYCQLQGYEWAESVLPKEEMLDSVSPRNHCTWFKVCQFAFFRTNLVVFLILQPNELAPMLSGSQLLF